MSLPIRPARGSAIDERTLRAAPSQARLTGPGGPSTPTWAYSDTIPGPVLRLRQGRPVRITVENGLAEDTTVHWHGIRLPNAMDGVPGMTQPPIAPGSNFTYEFTPPDAGTFWYHPHADSLVQLGRGLAGALIVEEAELVEFDRDLIWLLQDWRLAADGQISGGFGSAMDATMSGRIGNLVTINGSAPADHGVRAGERIRLRLANAALARMMALRFEGHRPVILAIDGQPCDPHEPDDGRVVLGPAMRVDMALHMQGKPGRRYRVIDEFYDGLAYTLATLAYDKAPPLRVHPLERPTALPRNPLPEPDLAKALRQEIVLQGGMMGGGKLAGVGGMMGMSGMNMGMNGTAAWAINGMSMTGDGHAGMVPQFTLRRGVTCHLTIRNQTAWWHPMHVHGFSLSILARNGSPVSHRQWQDTVLLAPKDTVECAFVADNPGDWMLHCHVADHQMAGLMTVFRVT
ncbi:multicopper oxidase family protein [Mesorhizobium sp. M1A.F.Ca.IN.022.07.1.1]|nr:MULTISPECIES: multicopper oxidase family protein [unclassified Mesorhizobium]MCT2581175.1 multicopper oxidase family protein [Mesorhizobium sp. P13.3]MDF3170195.1 multicopper oxidase family protein [Mesorhizobium sp. P16.1]MDF3181171.1 multicopper oxidase family protein [Mesorhizobium sp. P17.1]MDF3187087.1 multicopper oxidase family protein [Mesorhizobium sp. ICCV3110.1]RUV92042.1 multicopper oxidase family protein [Mesorhizobium sp. M1A.F.Ca.IN.022.07.1.1]